LDFFIFFVKFKFLYFFIFFFSDAAVLWKDFNLLLLKRMLPKLPKLNKEVLFHFSLIFRKVLFMKILGNNNENDALDFVQTELYELNKIII
jgi:hypothetical protein